MGWAQRWLIEDRDKLAMVLSGVAQFPVSRRNPVELVIRSPRVEKTDAQRALFHAVCSDAAPHLGLTPGQFKHVVKSSFYGVEKFRVGDRHFEVVQSSEDSDREEYSRLIDHAYQVAAEEGIHIPDRRRH